MKLIDPTDDALNEAFAVHVAGWAKVDLGHKCFIWKHPRPSDGELSIYPMEKFTTSADAVLPWLEKSGSDWHIAFMRGNPLGEWLVCRKAGPDSYSGTLPRAAVIALLRSKGVEIEFTNKIMIPIPFGRNKKSTLPKKTGKPSKSTATHTGSTANDSFIPSWLLLNSADSSTPVDPGQPADGGIHTPDCGHSSHSCASHHSCSSHSCSSHSCASSH